MAIKLDNDYFITADANNIMLCTKAVKRSQETQDPPGSAKKAKSLNVVGYYATLLAALNGYRRIALSKGIQTEKTLDGLRKYMQAFDTKLAESLKWEKDFGTKVGGIAAALQDELDAARDAGTLKTKRGTKNG